MRHPAGEPSSAASGTLPTAINLAKQLGNNKVVSLLSQTLAEEEAADEKLREIAQQLLKQAPVENTQQDSKKMSVGGN